MLFVDKAFVLKLQNAIKVNDKKKEYVDILCCTVNCSVY